MHTRTEPDVNARDRGATMYCIIPMFYTSSRRSSLDISSKTVIHDLWPIETGTKKEKE